MAPRKRRSVEYNAPRRYLGNESILSYWEQAKGIDETLGDNQCELYFVTLWETGSRIGEALTLTPRQIRWNNEAIFIDRMEVFKRRKKWVRDILIKRDLEDPLAERLIDFVKESKTDYLLPAHQKLSGEIVPSKHTSTYPVYTRINKILDDSISGKTLWPHLIRDQRAFFLKEIRGFDAYELQKWFAWARMEQVAHYVGNPDTEAIAKKLGIREVPK